MKFFVKTLLLRNAAFAVTTVIVTMIIGVVTIDRSPILGDGLQHLAAALNLINFGMFGHGTIPDMLREPGQATALAVMLKIAGLSHLSAEELAKSEHFLLFRCYNLFWIGTTLFVLLIAVWSESRSWLLCFLLAIIFCAALSGVPRLINRLNAEPMTMLFFSGATVLFASIIKRAKTGRRYIPLAVLLGLVLGLETLIWAQALHISIAVIGGTVGYTVFRVTSYRKEIWLVAATAVLIQCVVVLPWMYRNLTAFHSAAVSNRAPAVVFVRMLEAQEMTMAEVPCVFFAFSPPGIRRFLGPILSVDVDQFRSHQRCVRFGRELNFDTGDMFRNPPGDKDVTAIMHNRPDIAEQLFFRAYLADKLAVSEGRSGWSLIPRDLLTAYKYIVTMPLFIYRGIWSTGPWILAAFLFGAFAYVGMRGFDLMLFLFPLISHVFHALVTHNIPRYHLVELPFWSLALAMVCENLISAQICRKVSNSFQGPRAD